MPKTAAKPTPVLDLSPTEQKAVEQRLFAKLVWNGDEDECWIWEGSCTSAGYGEMMVSGRMAYVHRLAYELFIGPIPEGLDLDHVKARGCTSRACANPAHLEPVTRAENLARGDGVGEGGANFQRAKTHCPQGHPYSGANLYVSKGGSRMCRTCGRDRLRERRRRKRGS